MTLKRLKKKKDRAKSQTRTHNHSSEKYLTTPVNKEYVNQLFLNLKENNPFIGSVNGEVTSDLDDSRLMQLANAISVIEYHIPRLHHNLKSRISESTIASNFMNFKIKGIDIIPDEYKEMATWSKDDLIFYSNDKVNGTFLTVYKEMITIDRKDLDKLKEAEIFIDDD